MGSEMCIRDRIICDKLKSKNINPCIINWIISSLDNRKQRVVVDDAVTAFVVIREFKI